MKSNYQLQNDVMEELHWDPLISAEHIGVAAAEGVITLSGYVNSYAEKKQAEKAAERVEGVTAIVQSLEVKLPNQSLRSDEDIAKAALDILKWDYSVPDDKIKMIVQNGWITLEGEVESWYQKKAAEEAIENLLGVKGVINSITIKPSVEAVEIKTRIRNAMQRAVSLDADRVKVDVNKTKVTIKGTVRSFAEKQDAEKAAWAAPGVKVVENQLRIDPTEILPGETKYPSSKEIQERPLEEQLDESWEQDLNP